MAKTFITSGTGASQTLDAIQNEKVPVYNTRADAEADLANIEEGGIVATKDTGASEKVVDVVEDGNMNPVTSNGVYDALGGYRGTSPRWITPGMLQTLDAQFNATSDYSVFQGATMNDTEMGFYGFKHNSIKGGVCIVMSIGYGVWCGRGEGVPSTWDFRRIIAF